MSRALSLDLRVRVLAAVEAGALHREAGERFGVSAASVSRWRRLAHEQGEPRPGPLGGDRRSGRIDDPRRITDFRTATKLSCRSNTNLTGNQAFTLVSDFTGEAGQLQWDKITGGYIVSGDVNGDGTADFSIRVNGSFDIRATDFIL